MGFGQIPTCVNVTAVIRGDNPIYIHQAYIVATVISMLQNRTLIDQLNSAH